MKEIEEEGERLLTSSGWTELPCKEPGMALSWKRIAGSPLIMVRCTSRYDAVDADSLFHFMGTPKGFEIIDPDTKNHQESTVATFTRQHCEVTLDHSKVEIKGLNPRQFQTLNIRNSRTRIFCSKSVSSPLVTMCKRRINCYTTYVLKTSPLPGPGGAHTLLEQVSWVDMGGSFPACLLNKFNKELFFQAIHTRLKAHLKENTLAQPSIPSSTLLSSNRVDASSGNERPSLLQC